MQNIEQPCLDIRGILGGSKEWLLSSQYIIVKTLYIEYIMIEWACKSPIIYQVMTLKLQHFTRNSFLNFFYGGTSPEPLLGEGLQK